MELQQNLDLKLLIHQIELKLKALGIANIFFLLLKKSNGFFKKLIFKLIFILFTFISTYDTVYNNNLIFFFK